MHGTLAVRSKGPEKFARATWLVPALFWFFTYAVLSVRAEIAFGGELPLVSGKRVLATSAGAVMFAMVHAWIRKLSASSPAKLLSVIATVLPASIVVLGIRLLADKFLYEHPLSLGDNLRWVMVWAGYFGLWVSATLALKLHHRAEETAQSSLEKLSLREPPPRSRVQVNLANYSLDEVDWVCEALAIELAAVPDRERLNLITALTKRAGYEIADELDPNYAVQNARVRLVQRLARRMAD